MKYLLALSLIALGCSPRPLEVPPDPRTVNNLLYYGGPVILHPKTTQTYLGSYYTTTDGLAEKAHLDLFFASVGSTPYFNINVQYTQNINGVQAMDNAVQSLGSQVLTADPGAMLTDTQIRTTVSAEVDAGFDDEDIIHFVFPPPSTVVSSGGDTSCKDFCGYHWDYIYKGKTIKYAVIAHPDCNGCRAPIGTIGTSIEADSKTEVSSHELMEATSDPDVDAWLDKEGEENADKCNWQSFQSTLNGTDFIVQKIWSNADYGCVESK